MRGVSVYEGVDGVLACTQQSVESWNFGSDVCNVVEKGARMVVSIYILHRAYYLLWLAISKGAHDNVEGDDLIWLREKRHVVVWDKSNIVKVVKFIHQCWGWQGLGIVVYKPACDIPVQAVRNYIKQ